MQSAGKNLFCRGKHSLAHRYLDDRLENFSKTDMPLAIGGADTTRSVKPVHNPLDRLEKGHRTLTIYFPILVLGSGIY
jgi:hypothetical protein